LRTYQLHAAVFPMGALGFAVVAGALRARLARGCIRRIAGAAQRHPFFFLYRVIAPLRSATPYAPLRTNSCSSGADSTKRGDCGYSASVSTKHASMRPLGVSGRIAAFG